MSKIELADIVIGTGSYATIKKGNTVSITGDGGNAWGYFGPAYKKMAPRLVTYVPYAEKLEQLNKIEDKEEYLLFRKMIEDEYIHSFYEMRLKNLNVESFLLELYNRFGKDIILLCHEPISLFCHRRLVADYIELMTGLYIPELVVTEKEINLVNPIRYKKRLIKEIRKSA